MSAIPGKHTKIYDIFKLALSNTLSVDKSTIIKMYNNLLPSILRNPIFSRKGFLGSTEVGMNKSVQGLINYLMLAKKLLANKNAWLEVSLDNEEDMKILKALNLYDNKWKNVIPEANERAESDIQSALRDLQSVFFALFERGSTSSGTTYNASVALRKLKRITNEYSPKKIATFGSADGNSTSLERKLSFLKSTELTKEDLQHLIKAIRSESPSAFINLIYYDFIDTNSTVIVKNFAALKKLGLDINLSTTTDNQWKSGESTKLNGLDLLAHFTNNDEDKITIPYSFSYKETTGEDGSIYLSTLRNDTKSEIEKLSQEAVNSISSQLSQTILQLKGEKTVEFKLRKAIQVLKTMFSSVDPVLANAALETVSSRKEDSIRTCQALIINLKKYGTKVKAVKPTAKVKQATDKNIFSQYEGKSLIGKVIAESFRN